ncbi:hypothetical protein B0F90DRAFT_96151 [Multifurca ochricompacta]|uniref:ZZ-type domain-containing protein n=1 Tax=Multifurca ochricompacta TaxID=376703 RepID=A0AAD4MCQ6_9AGAM|nr:hypothetical protein B0F90DRAFT_96151 [Multifurca ochricompacta]
MDVFSKEGVHAHVNGANDKGKQDDARPDLERSKQEILDLIRNFKTDVDHIISQSLGMEPSNVWGVISAEGHSKPAATSPSINTERATISQSQPTEAGRTANPTSPPSPVIHANILCDMCREVIVGVRHKCLDCPDFDLCSSCLAVQPPNIASHSKLHALFDIEEPGGVWVHTVFKGEDISETSKPPVTNEGPAELSVTTFPESNIHRERTPTVAVHNATCDLCDSTIQGDRFKCFECPDFDACASCYAIVPAQHPGHSFARLRDPTDLKLPSVSPPMHCASCNGCGKLIHGVRYKCIHPACNDFDLCASCEALPIPVHPISHAMLKIREPGTYIPVVKRYGVEGSPIHPVASAPGLQKSQEDNVPEALKDCSQASVSPNLGAILHGQSAAVVPDTVLTPIPSNIPLPAASLMPPTDLVSAPHPEFQPSVYEESAQKPVSFAFGVIREGTGPSKARHYSPTVAPLLPVPSPPPALATEFIRAVPSLHQNSQYTRELTTDLHGSDARSAPWWGQSAWIPPTPPAPLPVPLRTPSTPRLSQSPEPLVRLQEQDDAINTSADSLNINAAMRPRSGSGHSHASLPHVPPTDFNELFDLASQFRHLLELPPVVTPPALPAVPPVVSDESEREPTAVEDVSAPTELASTPVDDPGTPLSLVALLSKPEKTPRPGVFDGISPGRLLSQLLDSSSTASLSTPSSKIKIVDEDVSLRASFVVDNNIPDGQIFPPGAEFVKSWRMRNDGPGPWPAETELVFVAGDKLMIDASERFRVGSVQPGEEVDVWTGEMKAPDVAGKYISYWRLCDSKGRRFGHSIWIDICVAEPSNSPTPDENCTSLAASSVVMPCSAPSHHPLGSLTR